MENSRSLKVLKRRSEFLQIKSDGRNLKVSPWLLLSYRKNSHSEFRCGWTVSKKVGNAVVRNRLKRWCREHFRNIDESHSVDINVIFLSRNQLSDKQFFKNVKHEEVSKALDKGWQKVCRDAAARS